MWIKKECSPREFGARCCEISVHQITGLLIALSIIACGGIQSCRTDSQVQAELILQVTELSTKTKDQEALSAAAKALYAAGSEEEALNLLGKVEEGKATLLLQIARYAALRGSEDKSIEFVRQSFGLTSVRKDSEAYAKRFNELIVEASKIAASAESTTILEHLRLLARNKELSAEAATAMILAMCEIAVASEDWRLLDSASSLVPFLTEDEAQDSAFLAMTWATAHRIRITADMNYVKQGLAHAESISDRPKKAQAFALLAEVARKSRDTDLMEKMVEKIDTAMTGTRGSQVVEGFCRVALVFRLGGSFAQNLLKDAMEYARKTLTIPGIDALPQKKSEDKDIDSLLGALSSRYFSWIAIVALKLDEIAIGGSAFNEALGLIIKTDSETSLLLGPAFIPFMDAIQQLDKAKIQKKCLIAMKQFANRIPESFVRSMVLDEICETAGEIAIARKSPEFLEVAWQALVLIPITEWQETKLIDLSYTSARLGDPQFVISRFPNLVSAQKPALDLKIYSAALTGLAETDKILVEKESRFLVETRVSTSK